MNASPTSFDLGRVLSGWWWLLNRDGLRIMRFAAFWVLATFALYTLDHMLGLNQGLGLFSTTMLLDPFFIGVIYLVALSDYGDGPMQVMGEVSRRYPALLILTILTNIGIIAGFVMLILPGIALAILWAVSLPVMLAENKGPTDALRSSFDYVRPHFWPVLGAYMIYLVGVVVLIIFLLVVGLSSDDGAPDPLLAVESLTEVITSLFGIYLTAAIYRELAYTGRHDVDVFD